MTRFVIRPPSIHRTPKLLARRLNADTRRSDSLRVNFDYERDIFLSYPHPANLTRRTGATLAAVYRELFSFANTSKIRQRNTLRSAGVAVPDSASTHEAARELGEGRFIVRPYRHQGGAGYRLTSDPTDFIEGTEYVQRVFPKDREYRVIYAFGDPLVTLLKRAPEGVSNELAWNHQQGALFQTITKEKNDRLLRTDFREVMSKLPIINYGHIVAADVMWSDQHGYQVCELNMCPGLTIPQNLERIANHVQGHR